MWYKNGKTFNSQQAIRLDNPNTSLPHFLSDVMISELGYQEVVYPDKPICTDVQYTVESGVQEVDGIPVMVYTVVDMFQDTAECIDMDGNVVPSMTKAEHEAKYRAKKQAEAIDALIAHFTDVTTSYIEGKVQEYNKATGLAFKDIDAFTKYAINTGSQHYAIASRFIAYADAVWGAVRAYQATVTVPPTNEEFKAVLDSVAF